MATKHTPGPWEAWNQHGSVTLREWRVGERNSTPGIVRPVAIVSGDQRTGDEQVANAMLIAAAPALLEGCRRLLAVVEAEPEACGIYSAHIEIARAAVAAATSLQHA